MALRRTPNRLGRRMGRLLRPMDCASPSSEACGDALHLDCLVWLPGALSDAPAIDLEKGRTCYQIMKSDYCIYYTYTNILI